MSQLCADAYYDIFYDPWRYNVLEHGRGAGASWTVARKLIVDSMNPDKQFRALCTREFQNSISESVHYLISRQIESLGLQRYFRITRDNITNVYGREFIFKGLHNHIEQIKSFEGITHCWIEEAEKTSEYSYTQLIPTIREDNSIFFITYNPEEETSATYQRFHVKRPPNARVIFTTWRDNPWFPRVLMEEMLYCKDADFELYEHVWEGKLKQYAEALIMRGKIKVEPFETPEGVQLYFGADFGYAVGHPAVLIRMFIKNDRLFIDYEAHALGIEIDQLEQFWLTVPESRRERGGPKWQIRADSARPDTINHMLRRGFNVVPSEKGKGSLEEGINFLRAFKEVIVHPRCKGSAFDFTHWKWKQDQHTKQVLPIELGIYNDAPAAARYALEPYFKHKSTIYDALGRK